MSGQKIQGSDQLNMNKGGRFKSMNQWSLKDAGDYASRTWNQDMQLENAAN